MRRVFAMVTIAVCIASLTTLPARADDLTTAVRVATPLVIDIPRDGGPVPARRRSAVRPILYGLQAVDALFTAAALRRAHRYEANPTMGPFAHGGVPTLALGFALGDIVRARLFHRNAAVADSADLLQAASNLDGIRTTLRSLHAP